MTPKTPAQEWAELEDEMAGLMSRGYRAFIALVESEQLPKEVLAAFQMREGRTIRALLAAGDGFMAKVRRFTEARIEEAKKPAGQPAQPKRSA